MCDLMNDLIRKLFVDKTDNIFLQFFRFIFVGGTAFIIDFSIYILLCYLGINYLIAAAVAFFISVIANYILSTSWVFNQSQIENRAVEFNIFLGISIVGWVFTEILLYLFVDILSLGLILSKIIASFLVLFWNFGARRLMFYGKKLN
ncbi:GtrA family protein [uncultured Methanobrevibacter sp.]|uniref:GtrA family protein n=2 Tax=uncultured Methanobrevibacter sp. TaxID=253161 RepID=UPI0025FDC072|nr:GtrA family protein [uncultured Methanobrevibacter sp.]